MCRTGDIRASVASRKVRAAFPISAPILRSFRTSSRFHCSQIGQSGKNPANERFSCSKSESVLAGLTLFVPGGLLETVWERETLCRRSGLGQSRSWRCCARSKLRARKAGQSVLRACREAGISGQSYFRWWKQYGGLDLDPARRTRDLEKENARQKRPVADLSIEKQVLKDIAEGNL